MSVIEDLSFGLLADTPNYTKMAKKSEARRRGVIDLGLKQIEAIFNGGSAPFYTRANANGAMFDPRGTYYFQDKKGNFVPFWAPGAKKRFRRGLLLSEPNNKTFTGFGDEFYNKRAKEYIDFALPQVADQYNEANKDMIFGLSNRGLLNSSVANQAKSQLARASGAARMGVATGAVDMANRLKRDVADAKQRAIQTLYQTADPSQASAGAVNTAAQFTMPSTFAPIVDTFANLGRRYAINNQINQFNSAGGSSAGATDIGGFLPKIGV